MLPTNMAFKNNYSNHVLHISPQNPLEKGGMELSSKKKTGLHTGKRKKRRAPYFHVSKSLRGIHGK